MYNVSILRILRIPLIENKRTKLSVLGNGATTVRSFSRTHFGRASGEGKNVRRPCPPAARQCVIRKSVVIIELGHGKKVCGNASRASFTNGSIAGSGSGNAPPFQPVSCMFGNIFIVAYEKASLPRPATVLLLLPPPPPSCPTLPSPAYAPWIFSNGRVLLLLLLPRSFSLRAERKVKNLPWSHLWIRAIGGLLRRELLNYKSFKSDRGDGVFCFLTTRRKIIVFTFDQFRKFGGRIENIKILLILHHGLVKVVIVNIVSQQLLL